MKYCKHCGKEVDDGATTCPFCFGNLAATAQQQPLYRVVKNEGLPASKGLCILSLLIPLVGIILAIKNRKTAPAAAGKYIVMAAIGTVISSCLSGVIIFV